MMCCGKERGWGFWAIRAILIPIGIAALVFLIGFVIMFLWNSILPDLFGWHTITFWQGVGLLVLSRILFGGFKCCHRDNFHGKMHRWHMSSEERVKLKQEWKNRCCTTDKKE